MAEGGFRRLVAMVAAFGVAVVGIDLALTTTVAPAPTAVAANGADFNPGMIISDEVFYDSRTMTVDAIQRFLNERVPTCRSGYTCLKDYYETSRSQPARAEGCAAYAGQWESAARIIYKVATACGINPRAILVLLEKEQGLVSDSWPVARQYRSATGYGCPDTADCDTNYYGFFNQVYHAAWQFKKYRANPGIRSYQAGRTNTILWHPNRECGSSQVYIQNQATAGLYIYTPYRPNAAALANLYGTGDGCSSYGNRNFWRIFTDWFGSTGAYAVASQLQALHTQSGGDSGSLLGPATDRPVSYRDGGVGQEFRHGWAYWSSSTGAFRTKRPIGWSYIVLRGPTGVLGYPLSNERPEPGSGASQKFQAGSLYWSPTAGMHRLTTRIVNSYVALGGPAGDLRYPTDSTRVYADGGMGQTFQNGWLFWSATTSIHKLSGQIGRSYVVLRGPEGTLGYPVAAQKSEPGGGVSQRFQKGALYWSPTHGIHFVLNAVLDQYSGRGGVGGALGHPVDSTRTFADGGVGQRFQHGWLYVSASGVQQTSGPIGVSYQTLGGGDSVLGYPVAAQKSEPGGGVSQEFQNGWLTWSPATGPDRVDRRIAEYYFSNGGPGGSLGYPLDSTVTQPDGSLMQRFQGGTLRWTSAGGVVRTESTR